MNQNTQTGHISWSPDYDSSKPKARPVDVPRLVRPLGDAEALAGELLAFIKVNHQRGTFKSCTDKHLEEHLRPFEDELKSLRANDQALASEGLPAAPCSLPNVPKTLNAENE